MNCHILFSGKILPSMLSESLVVNIYRDDAFAAVHNVTVLPAFLE